MKNTEMKSSDDRIKTEMKNYQFLTGDINFKDYGGKWYRCTGNRDYYVIELVNMDDSTGDTSNGKYLFMIYSIELDSLTEKDIKNCLSCYGIEEDISEVTEIMILEASVAYGHADMIHSEYTNNYLKVLSSLKKQF